MSSLLTETSFVLIQTIEGEKPNVVHNKKQNEHARNKKNRLENSSNENASREKCVKQNKNKPCDAW